MKLNPELERFALNGWIFHPVLTVDSRGSNRRINALFDARIAVRDRAKREENWEVYVGIHEAHFRLLALSEVKNLIPDQTYFKLVGEIWNSEETITSAAEFQSVAFLENTDSSLLRVMMTDEERAYLAELSDRVTVFRAHDEFNADGLCWTLDAEIANEFRFENDWPYVTEGVIKRCDIVLLFLRRNEFEVIAFPEDVHEKTRRES